MHLRQGLHRYCARMVGSVIDGEDVVQDALFHAYRKLDTFDENRPLKPWLFRIAHNQCIDFLRRRHVRMKAEESATQNDFIEPVDVTGPILDQALERIVMNLPPKERACLLLRDVLDYSLQEIAEIVDSTVGGVKSALNRGRTKLSILKEHSKSTEASDPELISILNLYVERFNSRDWDGLRELIGADAQLRVADRFDGKLSESPYFSRYETWPSPWRLASGEVDGEPVVVIMEQSTTGWVPKSLIRIKTSEHRIVRIEDYMHAPWMLAISQTVSFADPS